MLLFKIICCIFFCKFIGEHVYLIYLILFNNFYVKRFQFAQFYQVPLYILSANFILERGRFMYSASLYFVLLKISGKITENNRTSRY